VVVVVRLMQPEERSDAPDSAPVVRVTGFDLPYPPSRVEEEFLPGLDRVLEAVDRSLAF